MSFEICHAPGVSTKWIVTTGEPDSGTTEVAESLVLVEQLIADVIARREGDIATVVHTLGGRDLHLQGGGVLEIRWQPLVSDWRCMDCGVDTDSLDEYFMVRDELWETVVTGTDGKLCVGCLEARLGRSLAAADFTDLDVNTSDRLARSARLRDRLARG